MLNVPQYAVDFYGKVGAAMRRGRLGIILALLLIIPALALAAPATPYPNDTMLIYPTLTPAQQALFDLAYQAARRGDTQVNFPEGTLYNDVLVAMLALDDDCPELCAVGNEYTIGYLQDEPEYANYVELEYIMPVSRQEELIAAAWELADQAYGSEFQREWFLHDRLCQRVTYDEEAEQCHNAWGALMDGRAVCNGYARALTLLWRMSYLPCGMVHGQLSDGAKWGEHAWNLVRVSGQWAMTDATNNDQDGQGLVTHWYFNVTDADMAMDYRREDQWRLPDCTDESVGWHARTGRLVAEEEDMEAMVMAALRALAVHGEPLNLRFARQEDYLSMKENLDDWIARYQAQAAPGEQLTGDTRLFVDEALRCVLVDLR